MRSYTDEYIAPSERGRDVHATVGLRVHKSMARRSCAIIIISLILMSIALCAIVIALLPDFAEFFMWEEARYTVIAFAVCAFFAGSTMLIVMCNPRTVALFVLYVLSSVATLGTLGALCFFFFDRDFGNVKKSWIDHYNDNDYETLCSFEKTFKCAGWDVPCFPPTLADTDFFDGNGTTTQESNDTTSTIIPTTSETEDTSQEETTTPDTATSTTTTTTTTTSAPPTPDKSTYCPVCKPYSIDYSWPLCHHTFNEDVKDAMPFVITFSAVTAVVLLVMGIISYQVRQSSNARRRGALLGHTEAYL